MSISVASCRFTFNKSSLNISQCGSRGELEIFLGKEYLSYRLQIPIGEYFYLQ